MSARPTPPRRSAAVVLALLWLASAARAETSLPRLLEALELRERGDVFDVEIKFTTPIRYLRHAPADRGPTIQIQVAPVSLEPGDTSLIGRRESLGAPPGWPVPLIEVVYEGRSDGRFVVVRFSREVVFDVKPGRESGGRFGSRGSYGQKGRQPVRRLTRSRADRAS